MQKYITSWKGHPENYPFFQGSQVWQILIFECSIIYMGLISIISAKTEKPVVPWPNYGNRISELCELAYSFQFSPFLAFVFDGGLITDLLIGGHLRPGLPPVSSGLVMSRRVAQWVLLPTNTHQYFGKYQEPPVPSSYYWKDTRLSVLRPRTGSLVFRPHLDRMMVYANTDKIRFLKKLQIYSTKWIPVLRTWSEV